MLPSLSDEAEIATDLPEYATSRAPNAHGLAGPADWSFHISTDSPEARQDHE